MIQERLITSCVTLGGESLARHFHSMLWSDWITIKLHAMRRLSDIWLFAL